MAKGRISCRARDRLRQRDAQPRSFVPTIGVEQLVLFTDSQARDYRSSVHDHLGKNLGSGFRRHYKVLKSEQMRLPVIRPEVLADQVRNSHNKLRVEQARQIAYLLKSRLEEMLEEAGEVPLHIGQVSPYKEGHPHKPYRQVPMIGAYPLGWRGAKSRIATNDAKGRPSASAIVQRVGTLCAEVIAGEHEDIDPRPLIADPRIPIIEVKHSKEVPRDELAVINDAVATAVPEGARLSHPILTLKTGAGRNDVEIITLNGFGAGLPFEQAA